MANDLQTFEQTLQPLRPHFEQALAGFVPVDRLMRSIMVCVEKTPSLLQADRQSLINSAMSAACLGLEVDGVTGQAYFIPFKGKAQLVIGYKGMNTIAARSGYTVQGAVVREGDFFDYEKGDKGFVRHKKLLNNKGPIIAAWATASAPGMSPMISVLDMDELMGIKARSPGAQRRDSPWNDQVIGFPAMCEKSAKRRLSRDMPLNTQTRQMHMAASLDEAFEERGRAAWVDPTRGVQIESTDDDVDQRPATEQRGTAELLAPKTDTKLAAGREAALKGTKELEIWWTTGLTKDDRKRLRAALDDELRATAAKADTPADAPPVDPGQETSPRGATAGAADGGPSFRVPTTAAEYVEIARGRIAHDATAAATWFHSTAQISAREFLGVTPAQEADIQAALDAKML